MGSSHDPCLDTFFISKGEHNRVVAALQDEIRGSESNVRTRGSVGHSPYNSPSDVPGLNRIVAIDISTATARVEANMAMEAVVHATLPFGFLPLVVAADRTATVSDAFAATTSESSSFAFGTFDCTVTEIEIILGDGELVYARPDDRRTSDLFYGSAGSLNSLGLITALEICLVRAGPYVELTFQSSMEASSVGYPVRDFGQSSVVTVNPSLDVSETSETDAIAVMNRAVRSQSYDFVEAMVSHQASGVVISGRFSPKASYSILQDSKEYVELVATVWRTRTRHTSCMSTVNYLFRNMVHPASQLLENEPSASGRTNRRKPVGSTTVLKRHSYGISSRCMRTFLQTMEETICLVRAVLQPEDVGRDQPLGFACRFDFEVDCCIRGSQSTSIEGLLLGECHPKGFPYLHSRAPCRPGGAWFLHNNRWHVEPWLFHDDRWYVELRLRWKSELLADVSERVACSAPLRFKH